MATSTNIGKLLPISENNGTQAVSGRYLHSFLGSKKQFANWIKERIEQYGFVENQDYEVFNEKVKNPQGGRPSLEYALSLDMAKELSMVERTERGRQARRYFIACEQELKKRVSKEVTYTESEIKSYLLIANEAIKKSEQKIKKLEKEIMKEKAKVMAAVEIKKQECDLKNSCFGFLIKKKLYDEWHEYNLSLVQDRIYRQMERDKKALNQIQLPF